MLTKLKNIRVFGIRQLSPFKHLYTTALNPKTSFTEPLTKQQLKSLVLSQCSYGKFSNLMRNVVALPSVLLSAAQNIAQNVSNQSIYTSVSNHFSIEEMGAQIFYKRFDLEANCVKLASKGAGEQAFAPVKIRKELEEKERRIAEEEERKYAERTVEDLTKLCMKVSAPIELVRKAVKMSGFTNHMGHPRPISFLSVVDDADIIKWYAGVGKRWLDFFCCCHNCKMVKTVVSYHLRFSCILTLAEKHEATKRETIKHYTKDLKVSDMDGNEEVSFPTEKEVKMMGDKNISDPKPVDGALSLALIRLAVDEPSHSCVAHFCKRSNAILYRVGLLQNLLIEDPTKGNNWIPVMVAVHKCLDRTCHPLCSEHISDLYTGKITLQDVDCSSFVHVD